MTSSTKTVPENDPLTRAEQISIIDQAIAENKERSGAVMLVLNEVQGKIGHVSPASRPTWPDSSTYRWARCTAW